MSRKDFKVKLNICHQDVRGLSHSKITDEQLAYFFIDEQSAQDALAKFNIGDASITTETEAPNLFYKIALTKEQFGEADFRKLLEYYVLLKLNKLSAIKLKLLQEHDSLITDILLLSRMGNTLVTRIVSSNDTVPAQALLSAICDNANSDVLSSALLMPLDTNDQQFNPICILMRREHASPSDSLKALILRLFEKMTQASIDYLLSLKDESQTANSLFQSHVAYFFEKLVSRASEAALNQVVMTLGLEFVISHTSETAIDALIAKVNPFALKLVLMQRNHENKCGITHVAENLSKQSLRKLFEKLDPEWIDDLILLLPTNALQVQARNAQSANHSQSRGVRHRNVTAEPETTEKSLGELLLETQALNQDNLDLLQLIVEDDALKNLLLAVNRTRENHSTLFSMEEQHPLRDIRISEWSIADCKTWADKFKSLADRQSRNHLPEMIAVLIRGVELFAQYKPRTVQLLSLLTLLQTNNKGRLAQIATGEGKSLIVAMLAMIKILQGEKVDIVTSSPILAERDAKDYQALYDIFNISVSHNWDKGTYRQGFKPCYRADVVYGSANCFQADLLRTEYELENTRGDRPYQTVIVDEVDSMMIDGYGNTTRLSLPKPSMEYLNLLFVSIWQQLIRIDQRLHSSNVSDRENLIKALLKEYLLELINGDQTELYIPTHFKELCLYQVDNWIRSAMTARYVLREGGEYVISEDEEGRKIIAPVDRSSTGVVQNNMEWEDGLHQFLQIKHGLGLQAESLMTCFISNHAYFKRYGTHVYGMTGTLGGKQASALLQSVYPVDLVFMPTCRPKHFEEAAGILSETEDQWLCDITAAAATQVGRQRGVLLICESINVARKIHVALRESRRFPEHKIKYYTRNDNHESAVITETMDIGDVVIATNLAARGTDIQITPALEEQGGLFVGVTFLPENKRTEDQAFGRTARKGQPGTAQLIINKKTTLPNLIARYPDYVALDTVADYKKWRDAIETRQLQHVENFEFKKIALFDGLFAKYCTLRQTLREGNHSKFQLAEIEDLWSLWLKKWMDKIHQDKSLDETQIMADYAELEGKVTTRYAQGELENPNQMLLRANKNFWQASQASIEDYTRAIGKDEVASFQGYYNRAFARIRNKSGNYRTDAVQDLRMAKKILEEKVIPYLQAIVLLATLNSEQRESNTDLTRAIVAKINFYQLQIQSIDQAVSVIQRADASSQLDVSISALSDKISLIPSQQRCELYQSGLINLFRVYEIPKESDSLFGACLVAVLGVLQVVAGVLISVIPGADIFSKLLIEEGIEDIMFAVRSMIAGHFSWDHYTATKSTRLAVKLATLGIDVISGRIPIPFAKNSTPISIDAVKSHITSTIVRSGVREFANYGVGRLTGAVVGQFKSDIHHKVHAILKRCFNREDTKLAMNTLLSADLINGNQYYAMRMRILADEIIRSKQAVNQVSMNILKGVLSHQHAGLAAAIRLSDMALAVDKIVNLAEDFSKDFLYAVKTLAHGLPSPTQDHIALRNELCGTLASYVTKHIMAALNGEIVRPTVGSLLDDHVNRLADRLLTVGREALINTETNERPHDQPVVRTTRRLSSQQRPFRVNEILRPRENRSIPDRHATAPSTAIQLRFANHSRIDFNRPFTADSMLPRVFDPIPRSLSSWQSLLGGYRDQLAEIRNQTTVVTRREPAYRNAHSNQHVRHEVAHIAHMIHQNIERLEHGAHFSNIHVPYTSALKFFGTLAGAVSGALSDNVTSNDDENRFCGALASLAEDTAAAGVNLGFGLMLTGEVSAAAVTSEVPVVSIPLVALAAMTYAYYAEKASSELVRPVGRITRNGCHDFFNIVRQTPEDVSRRTVNALSNPSNYRYDP